MELGSCKIKYKYFRNTNLAYIKRKPCMTYTSQGIYFNPLFLSSMATTILILTHSIRTTMSNLLLH